MRILTVLPVSEICNPLQATPSPKFISSATSCNDSFSISAPQGQNITFTTISLFSLFDIGQDLDRTLATVNYGEKTTSMTMIKNEVTTTTNIASLVLDDTSGMIIIGFKCKQIITIL